MSFGKLKSSTITSTGRFAADREFVYMFAFCLEKRASLLDEGQVGGRVRARWVEGGRASVRVSVATWHFGSQAIQDSPPLADFQLLAIWLANIHWSASRK